MMATRGTIVDHANRNTLDNQKHNLRIATPSQNQCNRRMQKNNQLGFRGVYLRLGENRIKKYVSVINFQKKRIVIGHFKTMLEAAEAYNKTAMILHGEFASLNNNLPR